MLTVTDSARAKFAEILDANSTPEGVAVRLVPNGNRLGLMPDQPREGDRTFDHDGRTVLVMDERLAQALDERTIDVQANDSGQEELQIV